MNTIHELLEIAIERRASDLIIKAGNAPALRVDGRMEWTGLPLVTPDSAEELAQQILFSAMRDTLLQSPGPTQSAVAARDPEELEELRRRGEWSGVFSIPCLARVRASLYLQRGTIGADLHLVPWQPLSLEELGMPPLLKRMALEEQGLILLTGPRGAGVTTTKAALIEEINRNVAHRIFSIEDPIEYVFTDRKSVVHQREVGRDTASVSAALHGILRHNPDVIALDLCSDLTAIDQAIRAARSGRLVIVALHASSIRDALQNLVSQFEGADQERVRRGLAEVLLCAVSQRLIRRTEGDGRVPAVELLMNTPEVCEALKSGRMEELPAKAPSDEALERH